MTLTYRCADPRYYLRKKNTNDTEAETVTATCMWDPKDWDVKPGDFDCICESFTNIPFYFKAAFLD